MSRVIHWLYSWKVASAAVFSIQMTAGLPYVFVILVVFVTVVEKGKVVYSSSRKCFTATGTHVPYGITQHYLPPAEVTFLPLHQPELILDLATPEGCKAELTWLVG